MSSTRPAVLSQLKQWIVGSCIVWTGLGIALLWLYLPGRLSSVPDIAHAPLHVSEPAGPTESSGIVIPDRLGKGETLSTLLERNGFYGADQHALTTALGEHLPLRRLRPGSEIEFRYAPDTGEPSVWVESGKTQRVQATRTRSGWRAQLIQLEVDTELVGRWGVVEGNLFDSMAAIGETAPLVIAFANVLQWDFDFHSQSREGDRFGVVVEKTYLDGEFVGYGELKAVVYESGDSWLAGVLFRGTDDHEDYYDLEGQSTRKAFLRAPLEFQRISSGFSYNRLHPVHGTRRPHLAVDYVALRGTPVHSVADGVVTFRGRSGGSGNMVSVRHVHGYVSSYLHLSRFAKGLAKGHRVQQKQVIGYVGSTGTATGAHLDFRLKKNGQPVNPLKQIFPPGPPVPPAHRRAFEQTRDSVMSRLGLDKGWLGGDRVTRRRDPSERVLSPSEDQPETSAKKAGSD